MKVLFAKCFGIGNAVMAVPALKALRAICPVDTQIDVLVGTTPDDVGARDVMLRLLKDPHSDMYGKNVPVIDHVFCNTAMGEEYDLAILSIPFDGRWQNGTHFIARKVIDGRTRPDPSTTGLISWKKHEAEYQVDNIVPRFDGSCQFISDERLRQIEGHWRDWKKRIYLGVGYKKDAAGFWKVKHWGNDNYIQLIRRLLASDPELQVVSTGDIGDLQFSLAPIIRGVNDQRLHIIPMTHLLDCFEIVASCGTYVGNDTGMGHVAAACDRRVITIHNLENSIVKSHPLCEHRIELDGSKTPVTVDQVLDAYKELMSR